MADLTWTGGIAARFGEASELLAARLPDLVAAALILVAGLTAAWLLSRLAAFLVRSGLTRLGRSEWFHSRPEDAAVYRRAPQVARSVVFWSVLLLALVATLEVFELSVVSDWMVSLAGYVPRLLGGLLLILLGFVGGDLAHNLVVAAATKARSEHAVGLGRAAQGLVILVGVILGIEQLGVASTVLTVTLAVLAASTLGAAGLAFGLGARATVANLLAIQQIKSAYQAGDTIQVDDVVGRILELTQTAVILETASGRLTVPGHLFNERITSRVLER